MSQQDTNTCKKLDFLKLMVKNFLRNELLAKSPELAPRNWDPQNYLKYLSFIHEVDKWFTYQSESRDRLLTDKYYVH